MHIRIRFAAHVAAIFVAAGWAQAANAAPGVDPALQRAARVLGVAQATTLEFSGTGRWFQFGQAPAPGSPGRRSLCLTTAPAWTTACPPHACRSRGCR